MNTTRAGLTGCVLALVIAASSAMAQDAATPDALGAAECTVDPIDPEAYVATIAAATPAPPLPVNTDGVAADDATVAAVTDTMRQSIACTNAGDLARLLALIDPAYAPTILGVPFDRVDEAVRAAVTDSPGDTPATPLTDDLDGTSLQSTLLRITDITVLPDAFFKGQVSAIVTIRRPGIAVVTATVYLREEQGRYVITNYVYHTTPTTPSV